MIAKAVHLEQEHGIDGGKMMEKGNGGLGTRVVRETFSINVFLIITLSFLMRDGISGRGRLPSLLGFRSTFRPCHIMYV